MIILGRNVSVKAFPDQTVFLVEHSEFRRYNIAFDPSGF